MTATRSTVYDERMELLITFRTPADAERVDLTYLGNLAGSNDDGTQVRLEPDLGHVVLPDDGVLGIVQQALNAARAGATVEPAPEQ